MKKAVSSYIRHRLVSARTRLLAAPHLSQPLLGIQRGMRHLRVCVIRGIHQQPNSNEPCQCLNCGTHYTGNFCPRCGQSRNTEHYRFSSVFRHIASAFFNIDNGFCRTLLELIYRPGYLINDFLRGKRVMYFRPFQTLFVLAALYLMTVQLIDPDALIEPESPAYNKTATVWTEMRDSLQHEIDEADTDMERQMLQQSLQLHELRVNPSDSLTTASQSTDKLTGTLLVLKKCQEAFQHSPFLSRVWGLLESWIKGNKAFSILLTIPIFALSSRWVFRKRPPCRKYNLTEHVFIQAFIACQILLASILAVLLNGKATVDDLYDIPAAYIYLLFCYDHWQLYRIGWWKSCRDTLFMFICSLLVLILSAIVVTGLIVAVFYYWLPTK